jgi:preprotein translocase subunit YajC
MKRKYIIIWCISSLLIILLWYYIYMYLQINKDQELKKEILEMQQGAVL